MFGFRLDRRPWREGVNVMLYVANLARLSQLSPDNAAKLLIHIAARA
jgi:hypothetical protein